MKERGGEVGGRSQVVVENLYMGINHEKMVVAHDTTTWDEVESLAWQVAMGQTTRKTNW